MPDSPSATLSARLADEAATASFAARVAGRARVRDVIALHGGLGAGKTTFARAFLRARPGGGAIAEAPSPTFTLVQTYDLAPPVWHFDLYRLAHADEVWELGFEDALAEAISLIEWPERIGSLLPENRLDITLALDPASHQARLLQLRGAGDWADRAQGLI